jgi:uncharacterized membrane protein YvbJ
MLTCVDCGSELDTNGRYCPVCGSPTLVKPPTEKDLRDMSTHDPERFNPKHRTKMIIIAVLILIMLLIAYFISKMVAQLGAMGSRLY